VAVTSLSGLATLLSLVPEVTVKLTTGSGHIGAYAAYVYLGAGVQDLESGSSWFFWPLASWAILGTSMPYALTPLCDEYLEFFNIRIFLYEYIHS
jgi:hypothetical protein